PRQVLPRHEKDLATIHRLRHQRIVAEPPIEHHMNALARPHPRALRLSAPRRNRAPRPGRIHHELRAVAHHATAEHIASHGADHIPAKPISPRSRRELKHLMMCENDSPVSFRISAFKTQSRAPSMPHSSKLIAPAMSPDNPGSSARASLALKRKWGL